MKRLVFFIAVSNLLSFVVVYLFELFTGYLYIHFLSDYAFYTMLLLIALGTIFSFSGRNVGYSDPSNVAGVAASSLIENNLPKNTIVTKLESTSLGGRFLLSSLVPFAICLIA